MTDVKEGTVVPKKEETNLAKKELSHSERFTQAVIKQYSDNAGELKLTKFQQNLCKNYFVRLDQNLKAAEQKRLAKSEKFRDPLAFSWQNVNMDKLAVDVVAFAGVGLDPIQPNHVHLIPYKNNTTKKYDIVFIPGYRGKEIKARKYGLDAPSQVIVELVYKNDKFKVIKRDINNKVDGYELEVTDSFNRGEVIGGFYYYQYKTAPEKNKIRVFTLDDILKRKPDSASPEFWGGEKDEWKDGQKTGNKIRVEGWSEEMYYKTIYSAAWGGITIDASKIDDHYQSVLAKERELNDSKVFAEIRENANRGEAIGFEEVDEVAEETTALPETPATDETAAEEVETQTENGPGF